MHVQAIPTDTTLEAARANLEIVRRLAPEKRLELALELSENIRNVVAAGVRNRHPNYGEDQVRLAVVRLLLGDELFRMGYPNHDIAV
jgi:hypothetical protein